MNELVPQAVHDLLAFYTENHPEARFGDLDLSALGQAVASIDESASKVEAAEAAAARARDQFRDSEGELFNKVSRAISFLKIHVEQDQAQVAQLEAIGTAIAAHRRKGKGGSEAAAAGPAEPRQRRARKAKAAATADENQASSPETLEEALLVNDEADSAPNSSALITTETSSPTRLSAATLA